MPFVSLWFKDVFVLFVVTLREEDVPLRRVLKITMQQFYRPNGDSTQKRGVLADVTLPSITNHMDVAESDLDYAIEFDRVPAAEYNKYSMVSEPIVGELRTASADRRTKSEDFGKRMKNIERYLEQKEKKVATLNEEKFTAERKELDKDKAEEEEIEGAVEGEDEVFEREFYNNEVLNITLDYIRSLKDNKVAKR